MNLFQTLTGKYTAIEEIYIERELGVAPLAREKWIKSSKNIVFHIEDKREMRYCSLCQKVEEKIEEPIHVFQNITDVCPIVEELYQKAEKELSMYEISTHIYNCQGNIYSIDNKKPMKHCYVCDNFKEESNFYKTSVKSFPPGVGPMCKKCIQLPYKIKLDIQSKVIIEAKRKAREEKETKLLRLRKKRLEKEAKHKKIIEREIREREKLYRAEKELHRYYYFEEHGVYPTSSKSDNNVIYVWQDTNRDNTYKIGISSKRVGTKRIYEVAHKANMRANILYYEEVDDALVLEKELLKYGEVIKFDSKFDGCTEFRHLTEDDLINIEALINVYKITY